MAERARRSVGATVLAGRRAMAGEGLAANLAGGTHHAYADKGSGFCVFNDAAVTTRLLQAEHTRQHRAVGLLRVANIDLDVHQGNGTARIFVNDASVFTLSLHGARNFPFRKEPSDLDVELADGCGDVEICGIVIGRTFEVGAGLTRDGEIDGVTVAGADARKALLDFIHPQHHGRDAFGRADGRAQILLAGSDQRGE